MVEEREDPFWVNRKSNYKAVAFTTVQIACLFSNAPIVVLYQPEQAEKDREFRSELKLAKKRKRKFL